MADEMVELSIEEVSGVDDPANLLSGWLVVKGRQYLDQMETDLEGDVSTEIDSTKMTGEDLEEAADEARSALQKMIDCLPGRRAKESGISADEMARTLEESFSKAFGELGEMLKTALAAKPVSKETPEDEGDDSDDSGSGTGEEGTGGGSEEVTALLKELVDGQDAMRAALVKVFDRIENLEKRAVRTSLLGQEGRESSEEGDEGKTKDKGKGKPEVGSIVKAAVRRGNVAVGAEDD